jgi:hypothetical protein
MSKTKEFNMLADKATKEAMDAIYNICDWTLTGDDVDQLLGSTPDINEAHSYMMKLVISNLSQYAKDLNNE